MHTIAELRSVLARRHELNLCMYGWTSVFIPLPPSNGRTPNPHLRPIHTTTPHPSACIASVVEELELHTSLGVAHHGQEGEEQPFPPTPACAAYTSFVLEVAWDPKSTVAEVRAVDASGRLIRCLWAQQIHPP